MKTLISLLFVLSSSAFADNFDRPTCSLIGNNVYCGYDCHLIGNNVYCGLEKGQACNLFGNNVYCGVNCSQIGNNVYCGDHGLMRYPAQPAREAR